MANDEKERVSPYRLHLKPNEEQRRDQWDLILISDVEVTVDFFHTDMLEHYIAIHGIKEGEEKEEEKVS